MGEYGCCYFGLKCVLCCKFFGYWLSRYLNSFFIFKLLCFFISCDVNLNFDLIIKCDCFFCFRIVVCNYCVLDCNLCRGIFYIKCGKVVFMEFK